MCGKLQTHQELGAYMGPALLVLFIQKNQRVGAYTKVSQDFTIMYNTVIFYTHAHLR